ncbi:carboxypeptidase-like regulatory domain-containing protein [Methanobrevibacter sp.]|uniref:carboxypeptidase-like regulatory domain-containing protein n=1 Tax=Methanobrevibacter sp. TaxID=66852 RepID=UPI003863ABBE
MEDVLSAGDYTVVATYMGDENFNSNTTLASFNVEKEPVIIPIASEFSDITIGDDLSINIVLKDENGDVIANAPITYVVNGTAGTTTTAADGSFTINAVNGAKVEIKYAGNETILPTNLTLTFNVPVGPVVVKTDTHFNIPGNAITINGYAVDTKAGEKGIPYATELLDANGKPIEGAKIQFGVNNKIYKRTTNENGSFTPYNLDMIRAGRYTMAFSFGGDDNYNSTFAVVCVDLDKKPITIKASAKTYKASVKNKKIHCNS